MKRAPLFEALLKHKQISRWSFHVPGHKGGLLFEEEGAEYFKPVLPFDVTELTGLDDLHHPEGAIKEAQEMLASFYGVRQSFYLVGGSTSGNLAMILAALRPGEEVLVQRNCHKSILNGLELAGAIPIFLAPEMSVEAGFPLGIGAGSVKNALARYPEVKGIILTNPNYYGMQQNIKEIAELIHLHGGFVLVDEAHGAHFTLKGMPESSILMGADIVVQSAHKTLPALTMGAFLHVNSSRIEEYRLKQALQMVQSSSPSYLIMASLDLSRLYVESLPSATLMQIIKQAEEMRNFIDQLPSFQTVRNVSGYSRDPLKVTVSSGREISGYELQRLFEQQGVFTELADDRNVLFVLPLGMMDQTRLKEVFEKISDHLSTYKTKDIKERAAVSFFPSISKLEHSYLEMKSFPVKRFSLKDADGYTAAEAVIPYPPGIPLIAKGEKITSEFIRLYFFLKEKGARFQGINEHHEMYVFEKGKEQG
jgi:arginine/lysine/ornithine decarboxylase